MSNLAHSIDAIEKEMLKVPQEPCSVIHRFGPGVYIREVSLPAGSIAIGHHQNFEHMNVFLKGRVTLINDDGTKTALKAPMIFVGKPGRKVGYIHEDVVWLNIYPTTETDIEKLEAYYLTKSEGFLSHQKELAPLLLASNGDQADYLAVLNEFGITEKTARAQAENLSDQCPLPFGAYKIKISKSAIEGQGVFATADIEPGELIAPARISGKRTPVGRFTNHSKNPNAKMVANGSDIDLVAIKPISGCHGGMDGEEITVNYRDALNLNFSLKGSVCQE